MDKAERLRREAIVLDQCGGMLPYAGAFYICSIIYAAEAAFVAFARYQRECQQGGDHSSAASAVHEALGHAAALSRFFWPSTSNKLAKARARLLRQAFEIADNSALKDRDLRNALEHYDERLDEFLLGDCVGKILPEPIVGNADLAQDPTSKVFKLLDPHSGVFVILGEAYRFQPVIAEVGRILDRAYELNGAGARLRPVQTPPS